MISQKHHHVLHALHFSFTAGLSCFILFALLLAYTASPAWLQHAQASGYAAFSQTSFWNTALPRYPLINAQSSSLVQSVATQLSSASLDTTDQSAPVYTVDSGTPPVTVNPWDCDGTGADSSLIAPWQSVPIPFYANPSDGGSHRMVVYQPSTQTVWEFDNMQKIGAQWQACHGGKMSNVSGSNGVFSGAYGIQGSGLATLGGQISISDIQRGVIGHAIGLSLPSAGGSAAWPATRSSSSSGSIPLGLRLQLDPTLDIDSLNLAPTARLIAKTAQKYGFVVWDTGPASISAENPKSYTSHGLPNPYGALGSLSLGNFPWDKLQALPSGYGQSGETPSINSFSTPSAQLTDGQLVDVSWSAVNVDECSIPGLADNLPSTGSKTANSLSANTTYTLSCSGPGGSTSQSLSFSVPANATAPPPTVTTTTITLPLSGTINILPLLDTDWAKTVVQKVVYYERDNLLDAPTAPPFHLNTTRLADGPHALGIHIYYRDGHKDEQAATLTVRNVSNPLSNVPAALPDTSGNAPTALIICGLIGTLTCMLTSAWIGWHRVKPHKKTKSTPFTFVP